MSETSLNADITATLASLPHQEDRDLCQYLLDAGRLKTGDIGRLEQCRREHGMGFVEAAAKLGMADAAEILRITSQRFNYPYLPADNKDGFSAKLVAAYQPFSPQVEAIRNLRSQLMLRWFNQDRKLLALVGLDAGEGCSLLLANLAIVFSQLGQHTLLVDANLRQPRQHEWFNLGGRPGLSDLLTGTAGLESVCRIPSFVDLSVLPAGTLPPNSQELLGRPGFKRLLRTLSETYDITLLDTPGGLSYSDTQNIVAETGAAVLVMHKHRTRWRDVEAMQDQLAYCRAQIVGAVLNES